MSTFYIAQVVHCLLQTQLLDQEGLLVFGVELEVVLHVAVPDLGDFSEECLTCLLVPGLDEGLPHQEIVAGHVRVLGPIFGALQIDLR